MEQTSTIINLILHNIFSPFLFWAKFRCVNTVVLRNDLGSCAQIKFLALIISLDWWISTQTCRKIIPIKGGLVRLAFAFPFLVPFHDIKM